VYLLVFLIALEVAENVQYCENFENMNKDSEMSTGKLKVEIMVLCTKPLFIYLLMANFFAV
jgi:hypothetical protein